jgi:hypothetical protein
MTPCGWPVTVIRVTVEQIANDFEVHPMTLFKWLRQADIDEGCTAEASELRGAPMVLGCPALIGHERARPST